MVAAGQMARLRRWRSGDRVPVVVLYLPSVTQTAWFRERRLPGEPTRISATIAKTIAKTIDTAKTGKPQQLVAVAGTCHSVHAYAKVYA
ncbi:hypothetical protein LF1_08940 [Rubripirellula obstinata]|uniref:Uncharacterized protein n=2 Tax=Rubripirellula obstinata TaxID=406547 RepID=A0A5B1CES1_9BACT|nr:hypothetical protein LF1_08940 [Rubripirellula obstinata]